MRFMFTRMSKAVPGGQRTQQADHSDQQQTGRDLHIEHILSVGYTLPQSRQSAKLSLKSSELGLPKPLTRRRVCPPPGSGGRDMHSTLARERGLGESQFQRGDIHCGTLYIYVLCALHHGLINYKNTQTLNVVFTGGYTVIEFTDRRYSQSCWYFRPSFVNYCLSNLSLVHLANVPF